METLYEKLDDRLERVTVSRKTDNAIIVACDDTVDGCRATVNLDAFEARLMARALLEAAEALEATSH